MRLFRLFVAGLAIAAASLPGPAAAQSGSGTITGIVKDSTGGAIPGAQVKVLNEDTNVSVDSVTNQEGVYRFGSLVPGKRADFVIVSLEGATYLPWEDPAAAVVLGGSPDRVIATYVDGEARYEKGGMDWQELTAAAHSARRAMLAQPAAKPVAAPRA